VKDRSLASVLGSRYYEHCPTQHYVPEAHLRTRERNHEAEAQGVGWRCRWRGRLKPELPANSRGFLLQFDGIRLLAMRPQGRCCPHAKRGSCESAMAGG
jgi:hypothetical protein